MKIGISAPSSGRPAGAYPGCLVHIQQGTAEVQERREDEIGEQVRDPLAVVPLGAEERDQRQLGDRHDDDERGERAERMDVVRRPELTAPGQSLAKSDSLDHGRDRREPEQRQPPEGRQDDEPREERDREEDEHSSEIRDGRRA
jgi:hypothetical protein